MLARATDTIVIGAGQAGLSVSHELRRLGIDHLVLERGRIGESWRSQRWDSFRLNTPAWMNRLIGAPEPADPRAFGTARDFTLSLERLAFCARLPVRSGVEVRAVERDGDGFRVATDSGSIRARNVVLASGAAVRPRVPGIHAALPDHIDQVHSSSYRNPGALEDGAVLVVGGGQSGVQIADELLAAGRRVFLATSKVGRLRRRYRGRDSLEWLRDAGFLSDRPEEVLAVGGRPPRQFQISGAGGGRTLSYQALERRGATLTGRLVAVRGAELEFGDDLARNADFADRSSARIRARIDAHIARAGIDAPGPEHDPADEPYTGGSLPAGPRAIDGEAQRIRTVLWATGMDCDTSWLKVPVLDERGEVEHHEGATAVPGLFVAGQPWLRTRSSAMIHGARHDAPHLAALVAARSERRAERPAELHALAA